jgi:DNA-binding response OmpR family regulator
LELNTVDHTCTYSGKEIPLTVKEYQLLEVLMRNRGRTVPRELLIEQIWGWDSPSRNALDALVKLTRKKLRGIPGLNIQSFRGVGYRLEVPDVRQNP